MFLARLFSPPTTMTAPPSAPPHSTPFSIADFNELVSNALDIDRIPFLNFAPPKSDPNSNAWIADLESYVDEQEEQDLLALPLLNLDDLSVDFSSPAMPTFFEKVKSRANALVRRGKHDFPSTTLDSNLHSEETLRSRAKPPPLTFLPSKPRAIPTISPPTNVMKRPRRSSSHSLFERDTHYPFSEPCMITPPVPRNDRRQIRKYKSERSLPHVGPEYDGIPPSPPYLIQHAPSRSPSPYTSPRDPPFPTPPLSSNEFSPPSMAYLNTRRGSDASTTSTTSVKSTTSTLTSRISSSFSKLANPFSRSRSKLGLTVDTNVVTSESTLSASTTGSNTCYSPLTPRTPAAFSFGPKSSKHVDFATVVSYGEDHVEESFTVGRVLTPEQDPFARADFFVTPREKYEWSDARSDTQTILSPMIPDNSFTSYSFPPTPDSPYFPSHGRNSRVINSRHSPPRSPPPSHPPPRVPPPRRTLPRVPNVDDSFDWTLNLPGSTRINSTPPPPFRKRAKSTPSAPPTQARSNSPFPLVGDLYNIPTPPEEEPFSPEDFERARTISEKFHSELQGDAKWPLPPKRTVILVEDETLNRGRSLNRGWHDVEPAVEFFSSKSPRRTRRHSIRFSRSNCVKPFQLASPSASFDSSFSSPHSDESSLPSPTSRALNERQLHAITKTFGSPRSSCDDYFSAEDNMITPTHSKSPSSLECMNPWAPSDQIRSSLESSNVSFRSAVSKVSAASDDSSAVPYTWHNVQVVTAKGLWEIWLLGKEGFLDGEEGGELKILANSWSKLKEFCIAHQKVVIGRNTARFFNRDPIVVRIQLLERSAGGLELSLSLEQLTRGPLRKTTGGSSLLAFQLPTPTTLGEIAKFCKKGPVGQGV